MQSNTDSFGLRARRIAAVTPLSPPKMGDATAALPDDLQSAFLDDVDGAALPLFAMLDAAKIPNLPEMLEIWDLPHQCLFQDDALETAGSVAPWIAQIPPDSALLRGLFTLGDEPLDLWGKDAAVFMRSAADIATLARHFRKFTKMADPRGKWFYVRFYDPPYLLALIRAMEPAKQRRFIGPASRLMIPEKDSMWVLD